MLTGAALMTLNAYGLSRSLRGRMVTEDPRDFSHDRIISADEAREALNALDPTDRVEFAMRASEIIGRSIKHLPYGYAAVSADTIAGFNLTVPIWENYFLYLFRFIRPRTYRAFQFNRWERAVERGIGQCGQQSVAVAGFLEEFGFRTGIVELWTTHVVATAEVAPGVWYVLDPDFGLSIPHSAEELSASPELVLDYYARFADPETDLFRDPVATYTTEPPRTSYGSRSRYPRGSVIEDIAYSAKWPFPALLILVGLLGMRSTRPSTLTRSPNGRLRTQGTPIESGMPSDKNRT